MSRNGYGKDPLSHGTVGSVSIVGQGLTRLLKGTNMVFYLNRGGLRTAPPSEAKGCSSPNPYLRLDPIEGLDIFAPEGVLTLDEKKALKQRRP